MHEPLVLFVTDLAGDVRQGIDIATRFAVERSATLVMLNVIPMRSTDGEGMLGTTGVDALFSTSEKKLVGWEPKDPTVPFLRVQEVGDPLACVAGFAAREQVAMIVMEMPRRTWFRRLAGATLTERVIEAVDCPVVTYRASSETTRATRVIHRFRPRQTHNAVSEDALRAILDARVEALRSWMHLHGQAVAHITQQPTVRDAVYSLVRSRTPSGLLTQRLQQTLELELAEYMRAWRALGVELVVDGKTFLSFGARARCDEAREDFVERMRQTQSAVSVPLDGDGGAPEQLLVLAGSCFERSSEDIALVFSFDARRTFLRILAQPGPTPSAETYAFDASGVMLSNSRFPDQLRRIGLLPQDRGVQTPRRIRVCDPGSNLLLGHRPTCSAPPVTPSLPLTRAAADAVAGRSGSDFQGYRDYRGVEVVGTWRWLPEFGFGVTAEVDRHLP